jgi:photosystem II stability/assembly factor-like uncharacterized protein
MKKVLFYIIGLFFISLQTYSQWTWEYPLPQGNNLNDIDFFEDGSGIGLAVGNKGSIIMKNDNASQWQLMDSVVNVNLFDINLRGSSKALAVGEHGTILSLNPDYTWSSMVSNTFYTLNASTWVTDDRAFAVGSDGLILKYEEDLWAPVNTGIHNSLNTVYFPSENIGISAGYGGVIMRTDDGGDNWTYYIPDSTLIFNDIHFPSANIGYIVGNGGIIVKTKDAGLTWNKISPDSIIFNYNTVRFFNDTMGYIAGDNGQIYYTRDGGKVLNKNLPGIDMRVNGLYHKDINSTQGKIVACGENGIILESDLWGEWENITRGSFNNLNKILNYHDTLMLAVGGFPYLNKPYILRYHNDNGFWEPDTSVIKNVEHYITDAYFLEEYDLAILCGRAGSIYKVFSDDSAMLINSGTSEALYALDGFPDANLILAVGKNGTMVRITNGGQYCEVLNTNIMDNLSGIVTPGVYKDSYAVGENGTLLRIRNAGNNIIKLPTGTTTTFYDVDMLTDHIGFAVGAYGSILRFELNNDVFSFDIVTSGVSTPLTDIHFLNDTLGYIVGDNGMILRTTNAGEEWLKLYTPTNNHLKTMTFFNDTVAFIGGYATTILKTINGGGGYIPVPGIFETKKTSFDFSMYPNPANRQFTVEYELKTVNDVEINLYDLTGKVVAAILNSKQWPGKHSVSYHAGDLTEGIYMMGIQVGKQKLTKKLVILK